MDWNSPLGVLRRAMGIERDGYRFYSEIAEMAASPQGREMFLNLARDEALHLKLLLVEYESLEAGRGWVDPTEAMEQDLPLDPANPLLPGQEYPERFPVFTPAREHTIENDLAALEFGLETEHLTYELYYRQAQVATDPAARTAYEFLAREENRHYKLLQNTRDYLAQSNTWWDAEEMPFFEG